LSPFAEMEPDAQSISNVNDKEQKKTRTIVIRRSLASGEGCVVAIIMFIFIYWCHDPESKGKKNIIVARKPRVGEELNGPVSSAGSVVPTKVRVGHVAPSALSVCNVINFAHTSK
jgi:hypothetical protein